MGPLVASGSTSSDGFGSEDSNFLEAIRNARFPGDIQSQVEAEQNQTPFETDGNVVTRRQSSLKRMRSEEMEPTATIAHQKSVPEAALAQDLDFDTYGASRFGEFGEYMRRKRAKLQIQNTEIEGEEDVPGTKSRIFHGVAIYINGWTEPSVQDLRQLIVQHGGIFQAYLDKKALVTHIITCSLTPAKVREFKHMKVVRPDWLVESVKAGCLLPWQTYIFKPGERLEDSQGRKSAQTSLLSSFTPNTNAEPRREIPPTTVVPALGLSDSTCKADDSQELGTGASTSSIPISSPSSRTPPQSPATGKPSPSKRSPPQAHYSTDPVTFAEAATIPGYSAYKSNHHAQRAMADPAWRAAHTSVAPDFIEGFYKNSRLHHLSTWKAELKGLVAEAQERAERGFVEIINGVDDDEAAHVDSASNVGSAAAGVEDAYSMRGAELVRPPSVKVKGKATTLDGEEERVIMHCDFDCFFVSAGLVDRPHLRGKPVVVCHSQGSQGGASSTSEIASASYEAREFGIKGGMSLQQGRRLCPTLMTIPYEFEKYKQFSLEFYTILMSHADDLQAVSVDEALIDVSSTVARMKLSSPNHSPSDPGKELAELIRTQVRKATNCEVSIGISHNILLARLATRRAKPATSFHLVPSEVSSFLAPLEVDNLHGFGYSHRQKAQEKLGTTNLEELTKKSKATLCDALGKGTGETLYKAIRGIDDKKLESDKPRKSVSCEINYGIRFEDNDEAETFIYQLAEEVARRLGKIDMHGRSLILKIMKRDPNAPVEPPKFMGHGACDLFNKQIPLIGAGGHATNDPRIIGEHAWRLLKSFKFDPKELRGIGIQIQKLEKSSASFEPEPGQAKLPFRLLKSPSTGVHALAHSSSMNNALDSGDIDSGRIQRPLPEDDDIVEIVDQQSMAELSSSTRPKGPAALDLPSFSQVDKSVFDALPDDVRRELEEEYRRRSMSPAPGLRDRVPSRGPSVGPSSRPQSKGTITVRGTANVKRITHQLAPRNRPSLSPSKNRLFAKNKAGPSSVRISEAELRKLDIDPDVFAILPVDLQREQLVMARQAQLPGGLTRVEGPRKIIKPFSRTSKSPSLAYHRRPLPKANHVVPPFLKQKGKATGEKLYFTETEDVQGVIEAWVEGFRERPPNQKDVDYFAKFLVQCVDSAKSTDSGLEKAVEVVKWWLVLLRRYFEVWEHAEQVGELDQTAEQTQRVTSESVGKAWWRTFREVKAKIDVVARKKFGGSLSLK